MYSRSEVYPAKVSFTLFPLICKAFPHDVSARLKDGSQILVEAKQRKKDAWATGERWLGQADVLVVRIDPEPFKPENEPRVYMKWSVFRRLVG